MTRYLLILLLLLPACTESGAMSTAFMGGGVTAASGGCGVDTDVLLYTGFEDNSSPYNYYKPSGETFTLSNAAINGDTTIVGSYTLDSPTEEDYAVVTIADISGWDWVSFTIATYVKIVGFVEWQRVFRAEYDGDNVLNCYLKGSTPSNIEVGVVYTGSGSGCSLLSTTLNASQGDTIFIEFQANTGTPSYTLYVDNVQHATATNAWDTLTPPTTLHIGQTEAGINGDLAIDQFMYSNDDTERFYDRRACTVF